MLSEKIYSLRKKQGLSQEQLAEKLNVSRQAISKWESGVSTPESDKLIVISEYFGVSLDFLMKHQSELKTEKANEAPKGKSSKRSLLTGVGFCITGVICLLLWGLINIIKPSTSEQISQSSMIQIDGNGIFLILCLAAIIFGAWVILKNKE